MWVGRPLKKLVPDNWFDFHTQNIPRISTPPPAVMETVVELFNEYRMENPQISHAFAISYLMTHLWRNQLSKDTDVLFTVNAGPYV